MQIIPRIYQKEAIIAALKGLRDGLKRALVVLATGLGKTFTAAFIVRDYKSKKTLFLVHNNFILKHAHDEFRQIFSEKIKMAIYNGMSKNGASEADIVFSTWQTMGGNLNNWERNYFDLIVVDEAHHSEAETYGPVLKHFNAAKLGITATPDRADGLDIRNIFGPEVIDVTLEEAIAKGWLPRIEYHVIMDESLDENMLQEIMKEIREAKRRFSMDEVNRRIFIRKRDDEVARIINGYNEKAIVFCTSISHAESMAGSLEQADTFHSKNGENHFDTWENNQAVLDNLKNGIIRRVSAVNAFNEGVNVPSVGLVSFCRVTDSETIFRQQLGRGLRPGKDKLIVLDFVGNLERIKIVLEMMKKIVDVNDDNPALVDKSERQRFEVSGKGFEFTFSDSIVDLMEVLQHCEKDFYPTWQEASDAAKKLGISSGSVYLQRYKEDDRLPSTPDKSYPNFPGWYVYLGKTEITDKYSTWQEASEAAKKLGIKSQADYKQRYKTDEKLPSNPQQIYPDYPGLPVFLGIVRGVQRARSEMYITWQEASEAAKKLGIKNAYDYIHQGYKLDGKLPSSPSRLYPNFPGWKVFLGVAVKYSTWQEASEAAKKLGIKSQANYKQRCKLDMRLPCDPNSKYSDFPSWGVFLETGRPVRRKRDEMYDTWQEAGVAARKLGISGQKDYIRKYKADKRLPSHLEGVYTNFPGWVVFLGKDK